MSRSRGMYETPDLNDSLLAHNMGITRFPPLPSYCNVVFLFLEKNSISHIENLRYFPKLKYLNLNFNRIERIDFNVDFIGLPELEEIHLSGNRIHHITPVDGDTGLCLTLKKLKLNKNKLIALPDFSAFRALELLDLSDNAIARVGCTLDSGDGGFLSYVSIHLPQSLLQLYLSPNEFIGHIKNYRKIVITELPQLTFFDKSFVTKDEVELAVAQLTGDKDAIQAVRMKQLESKMADAENCVNNFRQFQQLHMVDTKPPIDIVPDDIEALQSEIAALIDQS